MAFQTLVNRQFAGGFPGEIAYDGPLRAKPARIASVSGNRIARVFGFNADIGDLEVGASITKAAMASDVVVGGANFFGILGHPKHYTLYGGAQSALSPSLELPQYSEGEFFDMVTGMYVEVYNFTTGAITTNYGDQLAYVPVGISEANNPVDVPIGAIFRVAAGAAAPTGTILIPNAKIINPVAIAASADNAPVSALTIIQL